MTDERPRPEWALWKQISSARAWELVALSLDIEPRIVRRTDLRAATAAQAQRNDKIGLLAKQHAMLHPEPAWRFDESQEFNDRLEVLARNVEAVPTVGSHPADDPKNRPVQVAAFVRMALSMGWELPQELVTHIPAQDPKLRDMQQACNEIRQKTGKAASQRAVAKRTNYDIGTVRKRWPDLRK